MTSKIKTFEINGIIDTSEPVLGNLQKLCAAAACYFTFDSTQGKYSVVEKPWLKVEAFLILSTKF